MRLSADGLGGFGEDLGARLAAAAVVGFSGELGSGKTTLVQAICRGLGARAAATSPTYALVHHHEARAAPIYHVDCYRLKSPDQIGRASCRERGSRPELRTRVRTKW